MTETTKRDEREAFEKWARSAGYSLEMTPGANTPWSYLSRDTCVAREAWQARAALATAPEQAGEPYAYELHLPNDEYSFVYAAYLDKYATEEERACDRLELYTAPPPASTSRLTDEQISSIAEPYWNFEDSTAGYRTFNAVGFALAIIAATEGK